MSEVTKVFKDDRVPHLSFQWNGGFTIQIFDETLKEEVGGFSLSSHPLSDEEIEQEVVEFVNEQYPLA